MKKYTSGRSSLFLMEMIIAILFFSVVSALCLQLFVKSHTVSQDTKDLDTAVNLTSSVASLIQSSSDVSVTLKEVCPDLEMKDDAVYIYYNKDSNPCPASSGTYIIEITNKTLDERLNEYHLDFCKNGSDTIIYSLTVNTYERSRP